jgi:hypothetical protein
MPFDGGELFWMRNLELGDRFLAGADPVGGILLRPAGVRPRHVE